jgi:anti-sigma regulatory factor (Ser/Thr protein kinase)
VSNDSLSMVLDNAIAEVPRTAERIEAFCSAREIPGRTVRRFNLALDEALTNIISYAFPDGGRHAIEVLVEWHDGFLTATVTDDGMPFDPLAQPAPDIHAPLEQRKVGGLGIHLLRSLMDAADYRRADGRNRLTFRTRA